MTLIEKEKCTGCSACYNICPKQCIIMDEDTEGFLYPVIEQKQCITCGLCKKVCPVNNTVFERIDQFPDAYIVQAKDENIRIQSASGGLFASLAIEFVRNWNGVVFGAAYNEEFTVIHTLAETEEKVLVFQKSKYVQSNIGNTYLQVKQYLDAGRKVLFSGTPCQIYGLKSFLNFEYENLFCIDVVCHGVPSPKLFKKYLEWQTKKHGSIKKVIIRDKKIKNNFYRAGYGMEFKNGYKYFELTENDPMAKAYFSNIANRPACYQCKFKTIWRISDLTIGDCWFSKELVNLEDSCGVTLAFVQSNKGSLLLESSKAIDMVPIDGVTAVKSNGGMMYSSPKMNCKRSDFFDQMEKQDFLQLINNFVPGSKSRIAIVFSFLKDHGLIPKYALQRKKKMELYKRMKKNIPVEACGKIRLK